MIWPLMESSLRHPNISGRKFGAARAHDDLSLMKTEGHELVMSQGSCNLNYLDFLTILEKNDLGLEMTFNVLSLAQFI